jgi:hypothetical protein
VVSKPQIRFKGPAFIGEISPLILKFDVLNNHRPIRRRPSMRASGYGGTSLESAVRHRFWRMSIYRRPAIRHEYWRTIGPWSAGDGLKSLLGYFTIFCKDSNGRVIGSGGIHILDNMTPLAIESREFMQQSTGFSLF